MRDAYSLSEKLDLLRTAGASISGLSCFLPLAIDSGIRGEYAEDMFTSLSFVDCVSLDFVATLRGMKGSDISSTATIHGELQIKYFDSNHDPTSEGAKSQEHVTVVSLQY